MNDLLFMFYTSLAPFFTFECFALLFQILNSSRAWEPLPFSSSLSFDQIVRVMAQSRSHSTAKAYLRVIKKFLEWCRTRELSVQLPFSVSTVSLYLFDIHQSCASSAALIQAHAALKWFHSFVPGLDRNPLDSEFGKNIIESAKRTKSKPVAKKKPFSPEVIKAYMWEARWPNG